MVTYNDIEKAHQRISDHIHNTPILTSDSLDNELGSNLFFKCENFQKTGSFKFRGAMSKISSLAMSKNPKKHSDYDVNLYDNFIFKLAKKSVKKFLGWTL